MYVPKTTAWLRLDEDSRTRLLDGAMRDVAQRSRIGAMVYFATLAALLLGSSVLRDHRALTIAALAFTFTAGLTRWIAASKLLRDPVPNRSWAMAFKASSLLTVGAWGLYCAAVFYFYTDSWSSTYLLIGGAALAGGAASSLAPLFWLGIWALILIVLPTGICGILLGTARSAILGISACGYLAYLLAQIRENCDAYWKVAIAASLDALLSRQAATRSEVRFQTLFEDAPSGIYLAFPDGQIEMANRALALMLGYSTTEEIEGRNLKDFSRDYARGDIPRSINEDGFLAGWESDWRCHNGTEIRVRESIRAMNAGADDRARLLGIVEDVTARFVADQARRQLIEILEGTTDFVETIAATGEPLYANRASRAIGDSSGASAFNRSSDESVIKARLRFADQKGIWQGESWLLAADGKPIPVSQVIIAHKLDNGSTQSYSIISRDISAMRAAQKALKETEEQLFQGQRLESLGRLAGGIAHDFNNLLTVIMGYASVLEADIQDDKLREGVSAIAKAAERAADLTKQLLAFGRKQVLTKGVVDVKEVVKGAERMLLRLIGERIQLATKLSDEPQWVLSDAGQLEQVLVNLILNARDAMPRGGVATIEIATAPAEFVRISVSDTGIGMDEDTMARVFEPFFTTKGQGRGTGLGLATAYGFIKQSGGSISVSSKPGEGTVFSILLPKCSAEVAAAPQQKMVVNLGGSEHILVVDDEPALRGLLRQTLAGYGYRVVEARDAEEAILLARNAKYEFDLLVTDVIMPGLTGPQLASRLKPLYPQMAVLFISGYPGETEAERGAFGSGAGYLSKPFTAEVLLRSVRQQLEPGSESVKVDGQVAS